MRYETPDQVMRKSMRSQARRMRPMVFGFFIGLAGVGAVFLGQAIDSGPVESVGAVLVLGGMALTYLGIIWFLVPIGRRDKGRSRNRSPAA